MQNEWIEIDLEENEENTWNKRTLKQDEYEEFKHLMSEQDTIYQELYKNRINKNDRINLY